MNSYVCAFRGRRDNYQIPLALAEQGLLDKFITDFYAVNPVRKLSKSLPIVLQKKINFRSQYGIPSEKVKCLWNTSLLEHTRHSLGFSPAETFALLDPSFSHAAALQAKKNKSNLLLYTPYAWEAFNSVYTYNPRKVLFQFHPHSETEVQLLTTDFKKFPLVQKSYEEETGNKLSSHLQMRVRDCWKKADLILCASSFTRETLLAAGAEPNYCKVIPYGIDLPEKILQKSNIDSFQVLFIGSGIQRKGLHHLIYAWRQANLPQHSQLTLVCRKIDPGIESLIHETPQVRLIRGTDTQNLQKLYESSSLFVMPSLVEGFGQVFLEALSYGCPVLGTTNTCLPDLGGEKDGIFLTKVSDIEELTSKLEYLANKLPAYPEIRQQARSCAERFSWKNFRQQLMLLL